MCSTGSERTHVSHLFRCPTGTSWFRDRPRERVQESGKETPLLISQGFSHGRGPERSDGENKADDESLRKTQNKQTEAAK